MKKLAVRRVGVIALGIVIIAMMGLPQFGGSGGTPPILAQTVEVAATADSASSGIQIQNLGSAPASVSLAFYPQGGGTTINISVAEPIPVNGNVTVYLPNKAEIPQGFRGSVVISSDQPVAAIAKTNWSPSRSSSAYTGFKSSEVGKSFFMPLVLKGYFNQTSKLTVQNTGTASAKVTIQFFKTGETTVKDTVEQTIAPSASYTWDQSTQANLGSAFIGSALITSASDVAAVGDVFISGTPAAVYSYNGFAAGSKELIAPLVRNNWAQSITGIQVQNVGTTDTTVTVAYKGKYKNASGAIVDGYSATDSFSLGPSQSVNLFNARPFKNGSGSLPNQFLGAATITSSAADIVAMVNDQYQPTKSSAAYNALPKTAGTVKVEVPLARNRHTGDLMTTGIQVANAGSTDATVTVTYSAAPGKNLTADQKTDTATIPAGSSQTFYNGGKYVSKNVQLDANWLGSAEITSNQPILAIVNDVSITNPPAWDASMFNAINTQ